MANIKYETIKDIVLNKFLEHNEKIAIMDRGINTEEFECYSYARLREDILALGTALNNILKVEDEKVAIIGENSYRWITTYLATTSGVGVVVPLDKELPANEILNLLKRSNCKTIVYSSKKKEVIDEVRNKLKEDIKFINMDIYKHTKEEYSLNELINEGKKLINDGVDNYINKKIDKDKFAILLFTSGTTAVSKGVMLSNANVVSNAITIDETYPEVSSSNVISFLPLHHTYELTVTYLAGLFGGGKIGVSRGLKYLVKDLEIIKPVTFCMVPLLLENLRKKIEKGIRTQNKENAVKAIKTVTNTLGKLKIDVRRNVFKSIHSMFGGELKYLILSGAPSDKETIEVMESFGFIIIQGYGLTETSPLVSATRINNRKAGTVGYSIKDVDVRIDLKADEEENSGEILVRGPNIMLGYYENEEETKKVLKKNWFYTGDIGYFDNKGNLVISGRCKNIIVTNNGKNIYPEEIESLINRIPLVYESLVYGDGENSNLEIKAKIILDEEYLKEKYGENIPTNEELYKILWEDVKKINQKLISYKVVKDIEIENEGFEKTTTMKIKRNKVLEKSKKAK